jgi:NADH:ubiquinone oxidoreductase subunit 5 (subunit L)/multisubunit Na+/H+ antiporter MnhA subunit
MGVLDAVLLPLKTQIIPQYGTGAVVALLLASFLALVVVLNVLKQLLFKNPNEPPIVFHWFPILGSTVTYGIDPYAFFFACRKKVR